MSIRSVVRGRVAAPAALCVVVVFASLAGAHLRAAPRAGCPPVEPSAAGRAAAARGSAVVAGVGDALVVRDARLAATAGAALAGGLARHFASAAGRGTAYVSDRPGDDLVVVLGPRSVHVIAEPGEVTHPSWSPDGALIWSLGSELRLRSASGRVRSIPRPEGTAGVFSPSFVTPSRVVAVAAERVAGPHGDTDLDNLWALDLGPDRWRRLSGFAATSGRWSAIRTPVAAPDGRLLFVRVRGTATQTDDVSFQLWSWAGGRLTELRRLPEERYLAGVLDGRLLWNRYDGDAGEWRLLIEASDGSVRDLGCGRVQVDPRGQADPDVSGMAPAGTSGTSGAVVAATGPDTPTPTATTPPPSPTPSDPPPTPTPSAPPPSDVDVLPTMAVLVGDFASAAAAEEVASQVRAAYGETSGVAVVDNAQAPMAVAPGVWAVILPVPEGSDVGAALAGFRAAFPEYAGWSWMVAIG